jgi:uncharacterized protein (DUF4213/DUF364 family)
MREAIYGEKMLGTVELKWAFYDKVISSVPEGPTVAECVMGPHWVILKSSDGGAGLAHFLPQELESLAPEAAALKGRPLREVAKYLKSWDFKLASIGLSAVTAAANSVLFKDGLKDYASQAPGLSAFDVFLKRSEGRKVAVIGHFPHLDGLLAASRKLTILERQLQPGDLPDTAAEYVLPEQDLVFMTGSTIINKTLPRLLELSQKAEIYLVGPSVPMIRELFDYGVYSLSGTVINDYPLTAKAVMESDASERFFREGGIMVNLTRESSL